MTAPLLPETLAAIAKSNQRRLELHMPGPLRAKGALSEDAAGLGAGLESGDPEFESLRARHFGTKLGTPKPAVFALETATSVRRASPLHWSIGRQPDQ